MFDTIVCRASSLRPTSYRQIKQNSWKCDDSVTITQTLPVLDRYNNFPIGSAVKNQWNVFCCASYCHLNELLTKQETSCLLQHTHYVCKERPEGTTFYSIIWRKDWHWNQKKRFERKSSNPGKYAWNCHHLQKLGDFHNSNVQRSCISVCVLRELQGGN